MKLLNTTRRRRLGQEWPAVACADAGACAFAHGRGVWNCLQWSASGHYRSRLHSHRLNRDAE